MPGYKRAQYYSIWTRYLLLHIKFECFFWQKFKMFCDWLYKEHQSKFAVFHFPCQFLILCSFLYKMKPWISKFCPQVSPKIQESEFTTPSNRPQLSRRGYSNYDKKLTKVSSNNSDRYVRFRRIKFRLKFSLKLCYTKTYSEYRKSYKKRSSCLFNHWNFRGSLLEEKLKIKQIIVN